MEKHLFLGYSLQLQTNLILLVAVLFIYLIPTLFKLLVGRA